MSAIAIITARGGSKRIPKKNIKDFFGKPIIAYSIEAALQCNLFDLVMVSTDDQEIAEISRSYGAKVPFFRSAQNSDDHSSTAEVIVEVLGELEKSGDHFEYACCIYPTAPLISVESINLAFNLLKNGNHNSVFPVCEFSYPIWRSFNIDEQGKAELNFPENINRRSQDLPKAYHDAGQFYWINVKEFKKHEQIFTSNSGVIQLHETEVQDIDDLTDWILAELKYSLLKAK